MLLIAGALLLHQLKYLNTIMEVVGSMMPTMNTARYRWLRIRHTATAAVNYAGNASSPTPLSTATEEL